MLYRLDTVHLEYPIAPSPARKPSSLTREALSLAQFNVQHSREDPANPLKYKRILDLCIRRYAAY